MGLCIEKFEFNPYRTPNSVVFYIYICNLQGIFIYP